MPQEPDAVPARATGDSPTKKDPIEVAAVQFEMQQDDKATNLRAMQRFVDRAATDEVDLVCFPERCLTGYNCLFECSRRKLLPVAEDTRSVRNELSGHEIK